MCLHKLEPVTRSGRFIYDRDWQQHGRGNATLGLAARVQLGWYRSWEGTEVTIWHWLVLVLDVYLILSLGPWIALQVLNWLLLRSGPFLEAEGKRFNRLSAEEARQSAVWSQEVRPGRYEQPDRTARENLSALHSAIGEVNRLWPSLDLWDPVQLSLPQILSLGSSRPLREAIAARTGLHALRGYLSGGEEALAALQQSRQAVQGIPARVRALHNESRAEVRRLQAILEAEQETGTQGLGEIGSRLEAMEATIGESLQQLDDATPDEIDRVVYEADKILDRITPQVAELDQLVTQAAETRRKAENLLSRVESSTRLAEERWEGLKARGATEPAIGRELSALQAEASRLTLEGGERTLDTYRHMGEHVASFDAQFGLLTTRISEIDELLRKSKEATKGDVQALAQAQTACDGMAQEQSLLELDQSLDLINRASEGYREAERQHGLGTLEGYKTSLALSEQASHYLHQAIEMAKPLPERLGEVRELLGALSAKTMGEWRGRADRVREQLMLFPRHWDAGLAGDAAEAVSNLEQIAADMGRIAQDVRHQRRFRQSELAQALGVLTLARERLEKSSQLIARLEEELVRIESLRSELASGLDELNRETLPSIQKLTPRMLPELRQQFEDLRRRLEDRLVVLNDPTQINYDETVKEWLPSLMRQLQEIESAHQNDVEHYSRTLRDAIRNIDQQWARLTKLEPLVPPRPEEDIDKLAKDLDLWRGEVGRQEDNPLALRDLTGQRAALLEARIETARSQVAQGRRALDALKKQYLRNAQAVRNLRGTIQGMQNRSQWPQLVWEMGEAEQLWERSIALERESETAATLLSANNLLQQAVSTAQPAEQTYARVEYQMESALGRLDRELQKVDVALERGRRLANELREEGPSEELSEQEGINARAERAIEIARAATTFEDALRYVREADNALGGF